MGDWLPKYVEVIQHTVFEYCNVMGSWPSPLCCAGRASAMLRIVSLHADEHRSPLFEAPMEDLFPVGTPLTYEAARQYFKVRS